MLAFLSAGPIGVMPSSAIKGRSGVGAGAGAVAGSSNRKVRRSAWSAFVLSTAASPAHAKPAVVRTANAARLTTLLRCNMCFAPCAKKQEIGECGDALCAGKILQAIDSCYNSPSRFQQGLIMRVWQQPLPNIYNLLSEAELRIRIESAKETLGSRLVILGHHYQQDAVIDFADFTGDSFELSRKAADPKGIDYVVFCGVPFMAESADILTPEHVRVILPDLGAGCSMADMANLDQTLECWEQLEATCPGQRIVPITYMNSSAAIKAFVGEHDGAVCTSSNCRNG